jgi:class 3 adenylate cyclase
VHIAYRVTGSGPVDLLWYPGAPLLPMESVDDEPSFARIRARLGSFCRVIQFDARGVGLSDPTPPSSPPTLEQWVDDALAVLDAVGVASSAVFAARDSTLEAVMLAAAHPSRVTRLVIVNGFARLRRAVGYPDGIPDRVIDGFLVSNTDPDAGRDATDTGRSDFLSYAAPSAAKDEAFRTWWDRAGRQGASPASARAILAVGYQADVRPLLPSVSAPTLVLHRKDNRNFRVGLGRYLAEHIPDARFVELPGADCLYWAGDTRQLLDEIEEFLSGRRPEPSSERVLTTVLFTDIVGSTEQAARVGDQRWRELLDEHDTVAEQQVARFSGRLIKTTGDGVLATFDGPARAVRCGCALRDALLRLGVDIRVGIHTGEVELRGQDIGGMGVHIAARVQALARPGEILTSRTVADLVVGSGIEFDDRGDHQLKGVPGTWQLLGVSG